MVMLWALRLPVPLYNPTSYKYLKPIARREGEYLRVQLKGKWKNVHVLVAEEFVPNPDNKPTVNHKDGNKQNNDMLNLEWVTRSTNLQHAYDTGLKKQGKEHTQSKALFVFDKEGNLVATLYGNKEWKAFGLDQASVNQCIQGKRKTHRGYTFRKEPL